MIKANRHPLTSFIFIATGILFLQFTTGCTDTARSLHLRSEKPFGVTRGTFRGKWWNYYERGLSWAEGRYYPEALSDLIQAANKRDGDQRMARTYGMHFVDYFPHREIGVIHYLMKNFETARKELEISISRYPSAKARFYLDRARKTILQRQTTVTPPPPVLHLDNDVGEIRTASAPVVLSGRATDEAFVSRISVNHRPVFMEGSQTDFRFTAELDLPQGRHLIPVEAENLLGETTLTHVVIIVDRQGPLLTISEMRPQPGGIRITAVVSDDAGVQSIRIDNRDIECTADTRVRITETLAPTPSGFRFEAVDRLGNRTAAGIPLSEPTAAAGDRYQAELASDSYLGFFTSKDRQPPHIRLFGRGEPWTVFLERFPVSGMVNDESALKSLTINGEQIRDTAGIRLIFNHIVELEKGENTIRIQAVDKAGNTAEKIVRIHRKIPLSLQLARRLAVSVIPFERQGESSSLSASFSDQLIDALIDRKRFRLIERQRLDLILAEQKLAATDLIDRNTAVRLGKLVSAHAVLTGCLIETHTGIEIVGRVIDTETSEILTVSDVYDDGRDYSSLRRLADSLALKIHNEFPLVGGAVIRIRENGIFTTLGERAVQPSRRILVYRSEPVVDPDTGIHYGDENVILGTARIDEVSPTMSRAVILDGEIEKMNRKDRIITQ